MKTDKERDLKVLEDKRKEYQELEEQIAANLEFKELADNKSIIGAQRAKKDLRLQELTASIDALTGGRFSDGIER